MTSNQKLCKHDWVGDDECAYCRLDELRAAVTNACSDMGCFCPDGENGICPMCVLEKALHGERPVSNKGISVCPYCQHTNGSHSIACAAAPQASQTHNPISLATSLLECSGGGTIPMLKIMFRTTEEMSAASDQLRALRSAGETSPTQAWKCCDIWHGPGREACLICGRSAAQPVHSTGGCPDALRLDPQCDEPSEQVKTSGGTP